jgi:hypothetical protein
MNGLACGGHAAARTAVPLTLNSMPPTAGLPGGVSATATSLTSSQTPTTPCPPSSAHSAAILSIAVRRPA